MPRGSHRVVSAGVRCQFESGHKQDDHALTLRAISGSMHRKKMYRVSLFDHLAGAGEHNLSLTDQPTTISLIWIWGEISVYLGMSPMISAPWAAIPFWKSAAVLKYR